MPTIDTTLFLWVTASPTAPGWLIAVARILATDMVPLVGLAFVIGWVRARPGWRPALLDAAAAGVLGLAVVQGIGWLHNRPRPFQAGLGANLLNHAPENSFPSDHATLMFALGFSLIFAARLNRAGWVLLALALAVSWARVFLGVHYPGDILGGAVLAADCVAALHALPLRAQVWTFGSTIYEAALARLHLPSAVFPRNR